MSGLADTAAALPFVGVLLGLMLLFAAALRLPAPRDRRARLGLRAALCVGAAALVFAANVAVYRNDLHVDATTERAFTPSTESIEVVRGLSQDIDLVYFYRSDDPAARAAKIMVELMGRSSPHLQVRTIDPDRSPGLANRYGMRVYNTAVILAGERRIEVITTDDKDIALGILRATRAAAVALCFLTGHGEYDIDNFAYHTHFEGSHAHSHTSHGAGVVQMQQHGIGRLRRALDKLGLGSRKISLATGSPVAADCAAVVEANPRTPYGPRESALLADYLAHGGSLMTLIEPDYVIGAGLAALLASAGVRYGDGILVDPADHYFTDDQMVAVTRYTVHPATRSLDLSFFPGVRPLAPVPAAGVTTTVLATTSPSSYVVADRLRPSPEAQPAAASHPVALAAEGRLAGGAGKPFRLVAVGDADFASNSFYPYMSNADLVLGLLAWLIHEERAPTMKPVVEVLPTVALTSADVTLIFALTVFIVPGFVAVIGGAVWWRRRR